MKIIVQGYLGKYSSMGEWVKQGLESLGHEVVPIDRTEIVQKTDADLYFVVDCSEDFSMCINEHLKIPKICWIMDTHMPGGLERSLNMAKKCDFVISTNREHGQDVLLQNGIKSFLFPITYNDLYVEEREKDLDVVMIGHPNSRERVELWNILGKYNSFCGVAETKAEFVDYMSRAKIVINQPTEPWDIILNNRFFEAMAYKSVLLQKRLKTTLIEDLGFGGDFLYWSNLDEIVPMIDSVLKNYNSFEGMRNKANLKVKEFSLTKILSQILNVCTKN